MKINISKSKTTKKKEERQTKIKEINSKTNPTNRELKDLMMVILEEINELKSS